MSPRIVATALLLLASQTLADEGAVFVVAPWSDAAPPCVEGEACRVVLGATDEDPDLLLARMLDARELAAHAEGAAEPPAWAVLEGVAAWKRFDLVALSIVPRPGDAAMGVDGFNARVAAELQALASESDDPPPPDASLILSPTGPLLAPVDPLEISEEELESMLLGLGARRLAVAAPAGSRTRAERGGRLILVGQEALELAPDGEIALRGKDARRVLVASDDRLETALREGRIVDKRPVGEGITRPWRFTLEHEGRRLDAIFKDVEKRIAGRSKERNFATEPYFVDSYRFERAAYLVDRMLGLGLVPPTVLREVEAREGSMTLFVEHTVQQAKWEEEHAEGRPSTRLIQQLEMMRLLDALILNTDRNGFNLLVGVEDLSLHAIDHSRSFRFAATLERSLREHPPRAPDSVYRRLAALDPARVHEQLDPLVGRQRVNALLARRDMLIEARRAAAK